MKLHLTALGSASHGTNYERGQTQHIQKPDCEG